MAKAALLEHYSGCEVEVAQVVWDAVEEEANLKELDRASLIEALVAKERLGLQQLLVPYSEKIAWSEARVLWDKRPDDAIAKEVVAQRIDLLIKPATKHGALDFVHAPLDWRLIRDLECAMLLSKSSSWRSGGVVLAAVDVSDVHRALNREILSTASTLAGLLDAKVHVLSVAPDPKGSMSTYLVTQMRDWRERWLEEAIKENDLQERVAQDARHIGLGETAAVIAELSHELEATLTVIGTHSRRGIGRLVLGNTAERAIARVDNDIVTVRAR